MSNTTSVSGAGSGTGAQIADTAREKAGQGATVLTQQASEVAETVKQQAAAVTKETGTQARELAAGLREQISGETRAQGERLVRNLRSLADELQEMGEHGQADSVATTVVRRLAQGGNQAAQHLEQRGPGGLLDEVQSFARRRPGLFLAGAALAGFAVGRTGKDVATASDGADAPAVSEDHAVAPATPLPEAATLGETSTTYGSYAPQDPVPPADHASAAGTSPLPSPGASGQWPQPDASR